ncbi:MAG: hypothetical protein ACE5K9_06765 [Candidatus Methylomirabilales bacterium]
MTEKPQTSAEVTCPCCEARLTIDLTLGAVLHHEPPPKPTSVADLKDAVETLKTESAQRDARFKERMRAQKDKGKVLDRKFQELLKKAKDDPSGKPPPRDIDLD